MAVLIESLLGGLRNEVVEKVAWDDYLALAGLNPSTIVKAVRGRDESGDLILDLAALKWSWDNPGKDTDDLLWGRAVHCLVFEPQEFERRYVRWEDGRVRRGKDYDAFRLDNWGKEVLSAAQWGSALEAGQSFVRYCECHDEFAASLKDGQSELTVFKVVDGIQCRGRIDRVTNQKLHKIRDLKTAQTITPRKFGSAFYAYFYDIKLGLYRRWLSQVTGRQWDVEVIAIEKSPPWQVVVIPIPDAVLDYGAEKGLKIIKRVRQCIESGVWPGLFGGEEGYLHVPFNEMEDIELIGAEEVAA